MVSVIGKSSARSARSTSRCRGVGYQFLKAARRNGATLHCDYCLSNPPFGVDWKKVERGISEEQKKCGFTGCFGAGLPRVSDKSPLFVQYMIIKFHKDGRPLRLPWRRGREAEVGTVATHRVHDDRERARHLGGRSLVAALPGRRQFPTSSGWMPFTHSPSPSSSYNFRYSQADRFSTAVWNALSRSSDQTGSSAPTGS